LALPALIHGFGGAETIAFAAEFAFWGGGAGALLAGTRLGLRQFLAATREACFADGDARATGAFGATGAFRTTLTADWTSFSDALASPSDKVKNLGKRHTTVVGFQRRQNVRLKQFLYFPSVVSNPFHLGFEDLNRTPASREESFSGPGFVRVEPPEPDASFLEIGCNLEVVQMEPPREDGIGVAFFQGI
jgi:hypothetical protein